MPVDEWGNVADIIADADSTGARTNIGRPFESEFGASNRDLRHRLMDEMIDKHGDDFTDLLTPADYDYVFNEVSDYYHLVSEYGGGYVDWVRKENAIEEFVDTYFSKLRGIPAKTDNPISYAEAIYNVENSRFAPRFGPVTYRDLLGNVVTTEENVLVGRTYMLLLDRTARDFSAVSSAKVNSYVIPIKGGESDKYRYPHSRTPVTNTGETETRVMSTMTHPEFIAEMKDLALNTDAHRQLVRHQLESEKLYDPTFEIDREKLPYGSNMPLMQFHHMLRAYGLVMKEDDGTDLREGDE